MEFYTTCSAKSLNTNTLQSIFFFGDIITDFFVFWYASKKNCMEKVISFASSKKTACIWKKMRIFARNFALPQKAETAQSSAVRYSAENAQSIVVPQNNIAFCTFSNIVF